MTSALSDTQIVRLANWLDPLDWREVFAQPQPIEIDIGCGKGAFLLWAAQTRPGHNFLGLERLLLRLRKVDRKARRLGLGNVRLLRLEAGYFVARLVPANSVAVYHIYFPDPWPKRRHWPKRLVNEAFAAAVQRTLVVGGQLNVATDHAGYFQQMERVLGGVVGFERHAPEVLPAEAQTDFERGFLAAGQPIWRACWIKRG